ncbi:MAG: hypothetical protein ACI9U2_005124 [Bradymonadia bacterium]|jgi:hypothetical protein
MRLVKMAALAALMSVPVAAQASDAEMSLVPQGSVMVLHVNMERLRSSAFYKTIIVGLLNSPAIKMQIDMAKKQAGFDPINDLKSLTIVAPAKMGSGEEPLVILDGKIDAKILAEKAGESAQVMPAKGRVLIGKANSIAAAQKGGGATALKALLSKTNQKADVWFVANLPPAMQKQMAEGNPMAKGLKTMRGSLDFSKGLNLKVALDTPMAKKAAEEAAKAMAQAVKEPMMTQMGIAPMLQKLQVKAVGNVLNVDLNLNDGEVKKLQMMAQMMMMMAGGGASPSKGAPPAAAPVKKAL